MNSVNSRDLSEYLKSMVQAGMLRQDMAEELNKLPTKDQQRQAYRRLPDACLEATREVVRNLLVESAPSAGRGPAGGAVPSPAHDDATAMVAPDSPEAMKLHPEGPTIGQKIGGALFWLAILGYFFRGSLHRMYSYLIEINSPAAASPTAMAAPAAPVPQLINATYVSGHRVRIRWTPLGDDYGYGVYAADASGKTQGLIGIVATPGAVVNVAAQGKKEAFVVVTAVRQDWTGESLPSQPVSIKPDSRNNRYSLEPLPQ